MQSNSKNPGNDSLGPAVPQKIFNAVIATIDSSPAKITPSALQNQIFERYGLNKNEVNSIVKQLVNAGELTYVYEFGSSFLERSFAKPVRISKNVVLSPPDHRFPANPDDVVVKIKPGASFGAGRHPTTRLAIKGIEFVLMGDRAVRERPGSIVLDVGTGSGVLILTAVLGGMERGLGIDIDPCARVEATENIKINRLENKILISEQIAESLDQRFSMILANLRYPSLKKLAAKLAKLTDLRGSLILSGIKEDEVDDLLAVYSKEKFECLWKADELGWSGVVLQKLD